MLAKSGHWSLSSSIDPTCDRPDAKYAASLAAGSARFAARDASVRASNPAGSSAPNASLHSRLSWVSRARAVATAGARCRTRQLALTCSLSSSVSVEDSTFPAAAAPGRWESAARERRDLDVVVGLIASRVRARSAKASSKSSSSSRVVVSRTKSTSPLAASACAAILASTNGRKGIRTDSAASPWSLCAFFLAAAARKSSSAARASATASGRDACDRRILPPRRTAGASPRAASGAPSGADSGVALEKNRDVTFLTEGCDTRGGGAVLSRGIGVVVLNGRATARGRIGSVTKAVGARTGGGESGSSFGTGTKPSSRESPPPPADGEAAAPSDCAMAKWRATEAKATETKTYLHSTCTRV